MYLGLAAALAAWYNIYKHFRFMKSGNWLFPLKMMRRGGD